MAETSSKKLFILLTFVAAIMMYFMGYRVLSLFLGIVSLLSFHKGIFGLICNPDEIWYLFLYMRSKTPQPPSNITSHQKFCYDKLFYVSRSFSAVILSLHEELKEPICLFYLVCRAIDTIEDDMKPKVTDKIPHLRSFYTHLEQPGWKLQNFGDKKEEIDLLCQFDRVIDCLGKIPEKYRKVIIDVAQEMGNGMADFLEMKVNTMDDYNLYCWYVAGLVGEGLSRLFAVSGFETTEFANVKNLYTSMGLFLQKTNITRDYFEDINEVPPRVFYPKAIWSNYVDNVADLKIESNINTKSLPCLNHMITDAMTHATDCLSYLQMIKEPSVFKFCAIPQVMAIATLFECYNNPSVFRKEVKIRKSLALKVLSC